jgi:hypothetical protein
MSFVSENTVATAPGVAYAGMIHPGTPWLADPAYAEGVVHAGAPVKRGTDNDLQVKAFASTDINPTRATFAGVVILETSRPYSSAPIESGAPVAVLTFGRTSMLFSAAVSKGQDVKIKHSDNTLEGFAPGTDPGAGYSRLPGLKVWEDTSAEGLAQVEVNVVGSSTEATASLPIRVANVPVGPVARASMGTDAASTAGSIYFSDIYLPEAMVSTGAGVLNGTTPGTDAVIYFLADEAGTVLRTTALAGTLSAVADVFQEIAWTSPISLPPGRYWVGFQVEGTTATHQTIATLTYLNSTGSAAGVFGTIPAAITPTTTTTANVGPFFYLYT